MVAHDLTRQATRVVALALAALLCSSCNHGKTLYPVSGEVFYEGQPAAGALVVLHPVEDNSPSAIRPSGYVEDNGKVSFTSYLTPSRVVGDGAPPGEYIVTISWLPGDVKEYLSKHPSSTLPDKLGSRYSQPDRSNLRAKVREQPTELPRIDLKKDGAATASSHSRTYLAKGVSGN